MNMKEFIKGNEDNIEKALDGLGQFCPMCRKEAGRVIEDYRKIKFTEYVKHKGEPDWEIAWNKRMLELIDKDPTGGAKEKRLKNIRHWEEVKGKNVKRSD